MQPTIKFQVENQHIIRTDDLQVFSSSRNYLQAAFSFLTDDWQSALKVAVFAYDGGVKRVLLEDDRCTVPWEALAQNGTLRVSVFGGDRITTGEAWVHVGTSGYREEAPSCPPTPAFYEQVLGAANRARELAESVRADADSGAFAGPQGPAGPEGKQGAAGKSAYQSYVDNGGELTEAEWLASIAKPEAPLCAESLDWLARNGDKERVYLLPNGHLAACVAQEPSTNYADPASDDWKEGYRLNSSGGTSEQSGFTTTNFIPVKQGDVIRVKGLKILPDQNNLNCMIWAYNSAKSGVARTVTGVSQTASASEGAKNAVKADSDGVQTYTVLVLDDGTQKAPATCAYIRISALTDGPSGAVVITVNQPIAEEKGEVWRDTGITYAAYALTDADREGIAQKVLRLLDVSYIALDNRVHVGKYTLKYDGAEGMADIGEVTV